MLPLGPGERPSRHLAHSTHRVIHRLLASSTWLLRGALQPGRPIEHGSTLYHVAAAQRVPAPRPQCCALTSSWPETPRAASRAMNVPSHPPAGSTRRQSRTGSASSSSATVAVRRAASTSEGDSAAEHPTHTASPRPRRRSSAANHDIAHVKTTASPARKASLSTAGPLAALNGNIHAPPSQLPSLPPMLLSATVYDPNSPSTASTAPSPSTAGLFTPSVFTSVQPTDYFNSKPRTPLTAAPRPSSRNKVDRVLGRSPLGSPAILAAAEPDARHAPGPGAPRAPSAARLPAASTSEPVRTRAPSAGHRRSTSRDLPRSESREAYSRSESRGHYRSTSRDHNRSESTSSRLDDLHHDALPRTRERREKDKKTMLSRALQKANTAVLLDNAQNFEGAMEAYEDACKLLQQVMIRSSQDEDRRKLDAIVSSLG